MGRRVNPASINIMDYVDDTETEGEDGGVLAREQNLLPPVMMPDTEVYDSDTSTVSNLDAGLNWRQTKTLPPIRKVVFRERGEDFIPKEDYPLTCKTVQEEESKETVWEFMRGSVCFALFVAVITIALLSLLSYLWNLLAGEGHLDHGSFTPVATDSEYEKNGLLGGRSGLLNMEGVLNFHLVQFFKQHRRKPESAHILIVGGTPYDFLMEIVTAQAILWDDSVVFRVEYRGVMIPDRRRREIQSASDVREVLEGKRVELARDGPDEFQAYNATVGRALKTICNGIQKVENEFIEALYNHTSAPNIRTNIAIGMTDIIFHEALCANPLFDEEEVYRVSREIVRYFTADPDILTIQNTVERETSLYDIVILYTEMFRVATEENAIRTTLQRVSHLVPTYRKEMAQVAPPPSIVFSDVTSHGRKHRELVERAACAVALSPQSFVHVPFYQARVQQLNHQCARKRFWFFGAGSSPREKQLCSIAGDLAKGDRVSMMITVARDNMQNTMHVCSGHLSGGKRDEL